MTLVGKYQKLIDPLLDPYFRGLSSLDIAELAKKSIRLTAENRRLEEALEEIEEIVNEPCVADAQEDCKHCDIWCEHKDILDIISRAKGEE